MVIGGRAFKLHVPAFHVGFGETESRQYLLHLPAMILFGGRGHSQIIHASDEKIIMAFGLEKPVFRILVNTMGTLGAIGLTTGVMPSLTLGAGGIGGSITGDNVTVYHLFNIKRLAYETVPPPAQVFNPVVQSPGISSAEIERMVQSVLQEFLRKS